MTNEQGKYVIVKEDWDEPGTFGACTRIDTSEGEIRGFVKQWSDLVERFDTRQLARDVTSDIGGDVLPETTGRNLVEFGQATRPRDEFVLQVANPAGLARDLGAGREL